MKHDEVRWMRKIERGWRKSFFSILFFSHTKSKRKAKEKNKSQAKVGKKNENN